MDRSCISLLYLNDEADDDDNDDLYKQTKNKGIEWMDRCYTHPLFLRCRVRDEEW